MRQADMEESLVDFIHAISDEIEEIQDQTSLDQYNDGTFDAKVAPIIDRLRQRVCEEGKVDECPDALDDLIKRAESYAKKARQFEQTQHVGSSMERAVFYMKVARRQMNAERAKMRGD